MTLVEPQLAVCARALLMLALIAVALPGKSADDLLDPDQAFAFGAALVSPQLIEVTYRIAEGYYLFRDAFRFSVEPQSIRIGKPQFPAGDWHDDEFFGRSEIYRHQVTVRIALAAKPNPDGFRLVAVSQGCADIGVCYLPRTRIADLVPLKLLGRVEAAVR